MRYLQCLSALVAAAGVGLAAAPAAHAQCGCIAKMKVCFSKVTSATFDAEGQACFGGFDACALQCKDQQQCQRECRAFKQTAIAACQATFAGTQCASGASARDCRNGRRQAVRACVLEARKDRRACRNSCKDQAPKAQAPAAEL